MFTHLLHTTLFRCTFLDSWYRYKLHYKYFRISVIRSLVVYVETVSFKNQKAYHVGRKRRGNKIKTVSLRYILRQWMTKIGLPEARSVRYKRRYLICSPAEIWWRISHMQCAHTHDAYNFYFRFFSIPHTCIYICVSITRVTHHIVYSPRGYNSTGSFPSCRYSYIVYISSNKLRARILYICILFCSSAEMTRLTQHFRCWVGLKILSFV